MLHVSRSVLPSGMMTIIDTIPDSLLSLKRLLDVVAQRRLPLTSLIAGVVFGALLYSTIVSLVRRRKYKLPPGPRQLPIIGNALQVPQDFPWITFGQWAKTYGDLMHVNLLGQQIMVVNSPKIARDLMEKRSALYSDRPVFEMCNLADMTKAFVLQPHNDTCKKQRRLLAQDFSNAAVSKFQPLQEKQSRLLAQNMLKDPSNFAAEVRFRICVTNLKAIYGYETKSTDDVFLKPCLQAVENFNNAAGKYMVNFIPSLKNIPRWMPGAGFLKTAQEWRDTTHFSCWEPYSWSKANLSTGEASMPNVCGNILERNNGRLSKNDEAQLVWATGTLVGAGLDTVAAIILTFLMCMVLNPEVQAKAHAELDEVVGKDRLPSLSDRPDLPYLRSIIAESMRFSPPLPIGVPHAVREDDIYEDYFLPKGSWIMPNIWQMLHDPEVYPDPMSFNPERFTGPDSKLDELHSVVFGFGRRACVGRHFGEATVFSAFSSILATCDLLPGLDENGQEVWPKGNFTPGTITIPEAFSMRVKPRSAQAATLLAEACEADE